MDCFEIGSCFKSYEELMDKLKMFCNITHTKFTTKDCRLIKEDFIENADAKERLIYTDLKLICVHGRILKVRKEELKRKRAEKNVKTGCPAYFRLKLIHSGVALQIVALNTKHNHPCEAKTEENDSVMKQKKSRLAKEKAVKSFKLEIKSEDDSGSDDDDGSQELIEVYIDTDDHETEDLSQIKFSFKGVCAPVFTPFDTDMSLSLRVISQYARFLNEKGVKAILVNSIVGESASMTFSERKTVTDSWSKVTKSTKQHLIVQVGGCPLPDVLELARHAEGAKASAVFCLPDLMVRPATCAELVDYLKEVGEAAPKTPLFYHHVPALSGVDVDMVQFLSEVEGKIPTFSGIQYCSSDLEKGIAALRACGKKYTVFWGKDTLLASAFGMGFEAAVATTANIYPQLVDDILNAVNDSDIPKAKDAQNILSDAQGAIVKHGPFVTTMKAAMSLVSPINVGPVRAPLKNLEDIKAENLKVSLKI